MVMGHIYNGKYRIVAKRKKKEEKLRSVQFLSWVFWIQTITILQVWRIAITIQVF